MKAHIVEDNSKGVGPNFSLRPVLDCLNCAGCAESCYAMKSYRMYENVREAYTENSLLAHENLPELFQQIREYLAAENPRSFRIHVAGDFISQQYLDAWKAVAEDFPQVAFLAFTKVYWLDYSNRPSNLEIVFSIWPGMPAPKRQPGIRFAYCDDDSDDCRIPESALPCFGRCDSCGICWSLSSLKRDVVFQIH